MKLYATITSERASKGQGGNKFLHIKLLDSRKVQYADFFVAEMPDGIIIRYDIDDDIAYIEKEPKGKQQKGECRVCDKPWSENVHDKCIPF